MFSGMTACVSGVEKYFSQKGMPLNDCWYFSELKTHSANVVCRIWECGFVFPGLNAQTPSIAHSSNEGNRYCRRSIEQIVYHKASHDTHHRSGYPRHRA